MKKFIKRLLLIVVLLLVVLVAAVLLFGGPLIKHAVNTAGPRLMGVAVHVEDVQFAPLRGHLLLKGLHVGNPEGFKTQSLFDMQTLEVNLEPLSLFKQTMLIRQIRIEAPEITYERGLKDSNIGALQAKLSPPAAAPEAAKPAAQEKAGGKKVIIQELSITGARVKASLTLLGGQALTLPLPPLTLHDIGGGAKDPQGVTLVSAINEVLSAVLASVTKVVSGAVNLTGQGVKAVGAGVGQVSAGVGQVGGTVGDGLGKAVHGVTDLFKKKDAEQPQQ